MIAVLEVRAAGNNGVVVLCERVNGLILKRESVEEASGFDASGWCADVYPLGASLGNVANRRFFGSFLRHPQSARLWQYGTDRECSG